MSRNIFNLFAALTLGAAVSCSPAAPSNVHSPKPTVYIPTIPSARKEKKPEPVNIGDFTIVEGVSLKDLASLEEVLEISGKPDPSVPKHPNKPTIHLEITPSQLHEIVYYVEMEKNQEEGSVALNLKKAGSAFLLNSSGFFVSAYHVFDDYVEKRDKKVEDFMLYYDPLHGFAVPAKPLIFSEKYDLLLGKVDIGSQFKIETTRISDTDVPLPISYVYTRSYNNKDYITGDLWRGIIDSGSLVEESSNFVYRQDDLLKGKLEKLDITNIMGRITEVTFEHPEKLPDDSPYKEGGKIA